MPRTPRTPKKDWADAFFDAFEKTHLVREAAKAAGCARSTVYKRRDDDESFRDRWDEVEEHSTEVLEQVAIRRATDGSDVLLIFLLKARRPDVYREHHRVQHVGTGRDGAVPIQMSVDVSEAAHEFLARLRDTS